MVGIATLTTDKWQILYDFLQTGTYALSTNNIYSAYNDELIANKGLPLVIIYPPSVSISLVDLPGNHKMVDIVYNIEVFHKTSKECKSLVDEIVNKLCAGQNVISAYDMRRKREGFISTLDYDSWQSGKHRIHRYTVAVNYRYGNTS